VAADGKNSKPKYRRSLTIVHFAVAAHTEWAIFSNSFGSPVTATAAAVTTFEKICSKAKRHNVAVCTAHKLSQQAVRYAASFCLSRRSKACRRTATGGSLLSFQICEVDYAAALGAYAPLEIAGKG